jgi:hypothetical protein
MDIPKMGCWFQAVLSKLGAAPSENDLLSLMAQVVLNHFLTANPIASAIS